MSPLVEAGTVMGIATETFVLVAVAPAFHTRVLRPKAVAVGPIERLDPMPNEASVAPEGKPAEPAGTVNSRTIVSPGWISPDGMLPRSTDPLGCPVPASQLVRSERPENCVGLIQTLSVPSMIVAAPVLETTISTVSGWPGARTPP